MAISPKNKGRTSKKAKEVVEEYEEEEKASGSEQEDDEEEGYEVEAILDAKWQYNKRGKKGPVKKGRPSATAQKKRKASVEEMDVDEEEAPKKQTKRGRPSKNKEPEPKSDEEEEEPEFASMDDYMKKAKWNDLIKEIETVENTGEADGELVALVTRADGQKARVITTVLAERCPQKLIAFYETHLKWRPTEEE
ncbi:unnamed protein product [Rhizoctonia solani]|uniref:Chromo shadow domain-containing protein n=1 Tax=Rhizoctonia solani TaxID=456999 RepID=A0A8H3GUC8_9AGAM|nr:unnamed protein product [Rhizoctonia solani]